MCLLGGGDHAHRDGRFGVTMILISLLRFAYVAEEHGVLGPALLRAEVLRRASVLRRHQLL